MNDKSKKPRRVAVNSPSGIAAAIMAGSKKIAAPSDVTFSPNERVIFAELCDEFSKSELTSHKIRLTATLAKEIALLDREQQALDREGSVLVNSHGNATANPRAKVVQGLIGTTLSLRRSLGIHARELAGGDARRAGIMRAHNKANETVLDDMDDEDLLARPPALPSSRRDH